MAQYSGIIVSSFTVVGESVINGAWEIDYVVLRFQRIHRGLTFCVTFCKLNEIDSVSG